MEEFFYSLDMDGAREGAERICTAYLSDRKPDDISAEDWETVGSLAESAVEFFEHMDTLRDLMGFDYF